ncbi:MAG: amino acid permease [Candidatus Omnitrophica bacterium]|nr:amino acid permease [Candidatus Omnitrophota bacterium]
MQNKRFGTFDGVFTPCLLSILGVIMYLRLGWVVGTVGLVGTLGIIVFANFITLATSLSMSSVVTNIRIGVGGAYSIITKSLGIEAGGAIGIPLYLSQAISVAFYIAGFSECWLYIFPDHNSLIISIIVWCVLFIITLFSAKLAFRIQYFIMAVIVLSLISIILGKGQGDLSSNLWQSVSVKGFWEAFAIFFPAVTGILAGASMSGELIDPKKDIPRGTLWAIIVSFIIYVGLAVCFASKVPALVLSADYVISIEMGRWSFLVILGIMGATLSSALNMFIGSPRVLYALAKNKIIPFSKVFLKVNSRGEPFAGVVFSGIVALITICLSSLNEIATLLTMIFLITYGMINLVVFCEETMGIVSFRPTFRVPKMIPFLGALGCAGVMFLIDVKFSLIAIVGIVFIYYLLLKRETEVYSPDIRSGVLIFLAEQFAKLANHLPYYPKIWKPNVIFPVQDLTQLKFSLGLIRSIVAPSGRLTVINIIESNYKKRIFNRKQQGEDKVEVDKQLSRVLLPLKEEGVFIESAAVEASDRVAGIITVMQMSKGMFFPPNSIFYVIDDDVINDKSAQNIISEASLEGLGIILLKYNAKIGFSQEKIINLWIRHKSPNINLSILLSLQLVRNWEGRVRILQVVKNSQDVEEARKYLKKLIDLMRLPLDSEIEVLCGEFQEQLLHASPADINIFGMQETIDFDLMRQVADKINTSVLFLRDSKHESALA